MRPSSGVAVDGGLTSGEFRHAAGGDQRVAPALRAAHRDRHELLAPRHRRPACARASPSRLEAARELAQTPRAGLEGRVLGEPVRRSTRRFAVDGRVDSRPVEGAVDRAHHRPSAPRRRPRRPTKQNMWPGGLEHRDALGDAPIVTGRPDVHAKRRFLGRVSVVMIASAAPGRPARKRLRHSAGPRGSCPSAAGPR